MKLKNIFPAILFSICAVTLTAQQTWQSLGPIMFPTNVSGQIHGIGRTTQMKWDPINAQTVYATTGEGGLWKSTNNCVNWTKTGTDNLPFMGTASVCIDHTNNQVIYLGTGDPNYYSTSLGVYKSTDGGQTWNASNTNIGTRMAVELLMDPTNNNVIVAATNNGIWRTTNAGANWTQEVASGQFTDMKLKPGSTTTLYAVNMVGGYYRSTDFGDNWTQITTGLSIPNNNAQGTRLAVSAAAPNTLYLGTIADEGKIFKSTDGGTTFSVVYNNPAQSLVGYDANGGGQGNYNFGMCADPTNANIIYVVAHVVWKSTNGGTSWTQLTNWWAVVHTDMHFIGFNPTNNSELFNANDGGVWLTTNGGSTWSIRSDGLEATECYRAATSNTYKNLMSIGTQDNGELYFYNGTWYCNRGGDWTSKMHYDYTSTYGKVYYVGDNGERRDVTLNGNSTVTNVPNVSDPEFAFSKLQNTLGYASNTSGTAYNIYRSTNLSGTPSWTSVGTMTGNASQLKFAPDNQNVIYIVTENNLIYRSDNALATTPAFNNYATPGNTNTITKIAPCKDNSNVVYLSCGNRVYRSADRGATWTNVSGTLPTININGLVFDEYSTDESVYLSTAYGVYYKNNTMSDWINFSNGLPTVAQITDLMIFNDGTANSVLRVSYYGRGVWQRSFYNSQNQAPSADFTASVTQICPGSTIQFTDLSVGNPTQWSWTFQGGTPAASTVQNPTVTYNTPGTYNVTLVSTNGNGNDTEIKSTYITVFASQSLPLIEGFQTTFPPSNWTLVNALNDGLQWTQSTTVGGYSASSSSAYIDNFNVNGTNSQDKIVTPVFNFSNITTANLQFDVAYARYDNTYFDSLIVFVSTDCGATFTSIYANGGQTLATAPDNASTAFVPTATQWRTENLNLNAYIGQQSVMFQFANVGRWGQMLYLDNININTILTSVVENHDNNNAQLYQNTNGDVQILATDNITQLQVYNAMGQIVYTQSNSNGSGMVLAQSIFNADAVYYFHITTTAGLVIKKLPVLMR